MDDIVTLILPRRRALLTFSSMLALPAFAESRTANSTPSGTTAWPGQSGNPVGFAAAPRYPGQLTAHSGTGLVSGTAGNPTVYSFLDFIGGTHFTDSINHVKFVGCRFQSNVVSNYNAQVDGATDISFFYCSFTPLATVYTSPPGAAWPSAGAGLQTTTQLAGVNCIAGTSGYQYGLNLMAGGPVVVDSCDFWGFGNGGPLFYSTTSQITVNNCWIHDACDASPLGYHVDGTGYVNGTVQPHNVTVSNCTIASIGNTQGIAFQGGSGVNSYVNIVMMGNYLSGFGYTVNPCEDWAKSNNVNLVFTNNTFGTDLPWIYGPIYGNAKPTYSKPASGNVWSGNRLVVRAGTSPVSTSSWIFTAANNGMFIWPDGTLSKTDFVR
jgi:hypothetical protein